jgi:hypothetical protein
MEKENVDKVLPWLNDWCEDALDLRIARPNGERDLWLQIRVSGPPRTRHMQGYRKAESMRIHAWISVTNDRAMILKLLGFSEPEKTLITLQKPQTEKRACNILCESRLFHPSMVKNTRFCKFGGRSTLFSYVEDVWETTVISEETRLETKKKRNAIHMIIENNFPLVARAKKEFADYERMHGKLEDILWGPSIASLPSLDEDRIIQKYHVRWERYLKIKGVETLHALCASDPAAALEDWLKFRGDGAQCPYDWTETL